MKDGQKTRSSMDSTQQQLKETQHIDREDEQLQLEISPLTQELYKLSKLHSPELGGLQDTIFSSSFDEDGFPEQERSDTDSFVSEGPFGVPPLIQMDFSSDSSYVFSRRRDVDLSYDTFTSSGTEATPEGYRREQRKQLLGRMDDVLQCLEDLCPNETTEDESSKQSVAILPTSSFTASEVSSPSDIFGLTDSGRSTIAEDSKSDDLSIRTLSFQRMLRFPLYLIADSASRNRDTAIPYMVQTRKREDDHSTTSDSIIPDNLHQDIVPTQGGCIIEEIESEADRRATIASVNSREFSFQLAQNTPDTQEASAITEQDDDILYF
mmetsp:Transcript_12620/g.18129  ORF Transcript_12620/g.18129 Transcript_12620/m.18129 type:complete len:323 (+) Transcript_12620:1548-2516(+)